MEKHVTNHGHENNINKRELSTSPGVNVKSQKKIKEDSSSSPNQLKDLNQQEAKIPAHEEVIASKVDVKEDEVLIETSSKEQEMKMEINEKSEEVKELHKEMAKMKKEYDSKYIEVVEEAKKV